VRIQRVGRIYNFLKQKARYKIISGGRGSAKSWEVAAELVTRGAQKKIRVLCCREIQRSIKQSVHKLLSDTIDRLGLNNDYKITDHKISNRNGTEFFFEGLWQNIDSIKSIEGIDYCWVEEAQTTSHRSWTTLTPTIRKHDSEIWITYNPTDDYDAVHQFSLNPPDNAIVIEQNAEHNPFLPDVLKEESEHMKKTDYELWRHIWGGETLKRSDAEVLGGKWTVDYFETPGNVDFYHGVDWGFGADPTVLVRCFVHDNTLYIDKAKYWYQSDLEQLPEQFIHHVPTSASWRIYADSANPAEIRYIYNKGLNVRAVKKTTIEAGIRYLRSYQKIVIHEDCKELIEEAKQYKYKTDEKTGEVTPKIIDAFNHGWDAIRYALSPLILRGKK